MTPFAVDANAIHAFQEERISGVESVGHAMINRIFERHLIALDEGGLCLQEWLDCAGGAVPLALSDWVNDQLAVGLIRQYRLSRSIHKELQNIGLPQKDHKWVRLAIGCEGRTIVTNDVDFFDPKLKNSNENLKNNARQNGGACSKILKKKYDVEVVCIRKFAHEVE